MFHPLLIMQRNFDENFPSVLASRLHTPTNTLPIHNLRDPSSYESVKTLLPILYTYEYCFGIRMIDYYTIIDLLTIISI